MIDDHFSDDINNDEEGLIQYLLLLWLSLWGRHHFCHTVIILTIMKRMTLFNPPEKGLIVIFDYERDNNDEESHK